MLRRLVRLADPWNETMCLWMTNRFPPVPPCIGYTLVLPPAVSVMNPRLSTREPAYPAMPVTFSPESKVITSESPDDVSPQLYVSEFPPSS